MVRRVVAASVLVLVCLFLLVALWPQLFSLERVLGIAQLVSLRAASACVAAVVAVVLVVVAVAVPSARRFTGSLALLFVVYCALTLAVLTSRGFDSKPLPAATSSDLTVLSWNTLGNAPGQQEIARVALASSADIVVLPETTSGTGNAVAALMAASGHPMYAYSRHFDVISPSRSTTLLISQKLGRYTVDKTRGNTSTLPTVIARPHNPALPTIVAVHAVSPTISEMTHWSADLTWLAQQCVAPNLIMAGDFNATVDQLNHGSSRTPGSTFGDCTDAGVTTHSAAIGTWPSQLPPVLGTQIDHVFSTRNWVARGMKVLTSEDGTGSDHRPILVRLAVRQ
ncbi:MAG: endonuclease/exonuclease/phosphatase family protein [Glaciihabitans sp.]|nr:endonuclease/exonuclease/phosphatase family protein [Glaciihabitans sp.]